MTKEQLLADNQLFVAMAGDLLNLLRDTDDKSCACCGVRAGRQHLPGHVCRELVEWRFATQYGRPAK